MSESGATDQSSTRVVGPPSEHDPLVQLDDRWHRANFLVASNQGLDTADHEWTRRAIPYVRNLRACQSDADRQQLAARWPAITAALDIYEAGGMPRTLLEARLLSGDSDNVIAAASSLSAEAVAVYEGLFFRVRDKLGVPVWVVNFAMGAKIHGGLTLDDVDVFTKLYAYRFGSKVIDAVVSALTDWPAALNRLDPDDTAQADQLVRLLRFRHLVLTETVPADVKILDLLAKVGKQIDELVDDLRGQREPVAKPVQVTDADLALLEAHPHAEAPERHPARHTQSVAGAASSRPQAEPARARQADRVARRVRKCREALDTVVA